MVGQTTVTYHDLVDKKPTSKLRELICKACGKPFSIKGHGPRVYCYRPECEDARESERKRRCRERRRKRTQSCAHGS